MLGTWELPYPPSLNSYYRMYRGRMLISAHGRCYRRLISDTLWVCTGRREIMDSTPIGFNISMDILMYPPDKRKRDVDNILKALLDSLQHAGLYQNDNQISRLVLERKEVVKNGIIVMAIYRA